MRCIKIYIIFIQSIIGFGLVCVCAYWDTRLNVFFSHQCIVFFLHQTLVFFYQFISVCALDGGSSFRIDRREKGVGSFGNPIIQIDSSQSANFFCVLLRCHSRYYFILFFLQTTFHGRLVDCLLFLRQPKWIKRVYFCLI